MMRAVYGLDVVRSHDHFFDRLTREDMPVQIAQLILRSSGTAMITYLSRVTPPAVFLPTARAFDERVWTAAAAKLSLPAAAEDNTQQILSTPLKYGGLGFRPHTTSSPAAYYASIANAMLTIRDRLQISQQAPRAVPVLSLPLTPDPPARVASTPPAPRADA